MNLPINKDYLSWLRRVKSYELGSYPEIRARILFKKWVQQKKFRRWYKEGLKPFEASERVSTNYFFEDKKYINKFSPESRHYFKFHCIDFDEYSVELTPISLKYKFADGTSHYLKLRCTLDKEEFGGNITIRYDDAWGNQMIFSHFEPSDLKGMFDFIARGYKIEIPTKQPYHE